MMSSPKGHRRWALALIKSLVIAAARGRRPIPPLKITSPTIAWLSVEAK
jgi:hypothetical protein